MGAATVWFVWGLIIAGTGSVGFMDVTDSDIGGTGPAGDGDGVPAGGRIGFIKGELIIASWRKK